MLPVHLASEPPSYVWGAPPSGAELVSLWERSNDRFAHSPPLQLQGWPGTNEAARQRHLVQT